MPDEPSEFTAEDLPHLNVAARALPEVGYVTRALRLVSEKVGFPVENREQLEKGLGDKTAIPFLGQEISVREALELIPDYYFPIESPQDFAHKVADMGTHFRHPQGMNVAVTWAKAAPEPKGMRPPDLSDEEIHKISRFQPAKGPAIGELTER